MIYSVAFKTLKIYLYTYIILVNNTFELVLSQKRTSVTLTDTDRHQHTLTDTDRHGH